MFVKKFLLVLLCGVAMLSFQKQSHAVLRAENFDTYNDGFLLVEGFGKWFLQSGGPLNMEVVSNEAVVKEDGTRDEDLRMRWDIAASGVGDIYAGLDIRVSGPLTDPNGSDTEYFAHFINEPFNFNTRMDVVPPTGGGDFSIGIASDDSTADAIWGTDLTFGTTYRIIARYNQTDNQAELWIDASAPGDTSILGDDKPDVGADINEAFGLRQSLSDYDETVFVDNIVIGLTFAEALSLVPEPTSMVLLLAGLAGLATRRRL